jgi:hypothetical protein
MRLTRWANFHRNSALMRLTRGLISVKFGFDAFDFEMLDL